MRRTKTFFLCPTTILLIRYKIYKGNVYYCYILNAIINIIILIILVQIFNISTLRRRYIDTIFNT